MLKAFCDRCKKDTTGEHHGGISGVEDADDDGCGTNQAPDCFDIVCDDCFELWRAWMKGAPPPDPSLDDEKPWRFCPWCGQSAALHAGDPTQTCGRLDQAPLVGWGDTREKV